VGIIKGIQNFQGIAMEAVEFGTFAHNGIIEILN
jgi:hypothetical protein